MQLHNLKPKTKRAQKIRFGRGGAHGKTSGRGVKGQRAHGDHGVRPAERDMIKKLPKLRGHGVNRARTVNADKEKPQAVNVAALEERFETGSTINPKALLTAGLVRRFNGRAPQVKILGNGDMSKKMTIERCLVSASAKTKIEAAGGTVA